MIDLETMAMFTKAALLSPDEQQFLKRADQASPNAAVEAASLMYSAKINERALGKHAEALIRSAEASEKYARNLARATWALAIATGLLVLVAIGQIIAILHAAAITVQPK